MSRTKNKGIPDTGGLTPPSTFWTSVRPVDVPIIEKNDLVVLKIIWPLLPNEGYLESTVKEIFPKQYETVNSSLSHLTNVGILKRTANGRAPYYGKGKFLVFLKWFKLDRLIYGCLDLNEMFGPCSKPIVAPTNGKPKKSGQVKPFVPALAGPSGEEKEHCLTPTLLAIAKAAWPSLSWTEARTIDCKALAELLNLKWADVNCGIAALSYKSVIKSAKFAEHVRNQPIVWVKEGDEPNFTYRKVDLNEGYDERPLAVLPDAVTHVTEVSTAAGVQLEVAKPQKAQSETAEMTVIDGAPSIIESVDAAVAQPEKAATQTRTRGYKTVMNPTQQNVNTIGAESKPPIITPAQLIMARAIWPLITEDCPKGLDYTAIAAEAGHTISFVRSQITGLKNIGVVKNPSYGKYLRGASIVTLRTGARRNCQGELTRVDLSIEPAESLEPPVTNDLVDQPVEPVPPPMENTPTSVAEEQQPPSDQVPERASDKLVEVATKVTLPSILLEQAGYLRRLWTFLSYDEFRKVDFSQVFPGEEPVARIYIFGSIPPEILGRKKTGQTILFKRVTGQILVKELGEGDSYIYQSLDLDTDLTEPVVILPTDPPSEPVSQETTIENPEPAVTEPSTKLGSMPIEEAWLDAKIKALEESVNSSLAELDILQKIRGRMYP